MTIKTITGDYLSNGLIDHLAPRRLHLVVENGLAWPCEDAWDTNPRGKAYGDPALAVDADGCLEISGSTAFCPDAGEMERVGLKA